jgi:hypothetical protein
MALKWVFGGFLVALMVCGVGFDCFASVQAESTKPSVPQFAVRFVNASYPVTTTNSYIGLSETTLKSNNSLEVTIKNQPSGSSNGLIYYNIRVKPHFDDAWTEVFGVQNWTSKYNADGTFSYVDYINLDAPVQSASGYTTVSFAVVETTLYGATGYDIVRYFSGADGQGDTFAFIYAIPAGGQLDVQVEALAGHASQKWIIEHPLFPTIGGHSEDAVEYDASSEWSNTQTFIIGDSPNPLPSQSPTSTPSPSNAEGSMFHGLELVELVIVVLLAAVVVRLGLVVVYLRKRSTK